MEVSTTFVSYEYSLVLLRHDNKISYDVKYSAQGRSEISLALEVGVCVSTSSSTFWSFVLHDKHLSIYIPVVRNVYTYTQSLLRFGRALSLMATQFYCLSRLFLLSINNKAMRGNCFRLELKCWMRWWGDVLMLKHIPYKPCFVSIRRSQTSIWLVERGGIQH
jgi:hypothetical protein